MEEEEKRLGGHKARGEQCLEGVDARRVAWHPGEVDWTVVYLGIMKMGEGIGR